jgi:hypothetical protein
MSLYNRQMNDETKSPEPLEPVNVEKLMANFSDYTIAELVLEIKQLREKVEYEQKVVAAKEFKLTKAEEQLELLKGRINTTITVLNGESDICLDCEAVKEKEDK